MLFRSTLANVYQAIDAKLEIVPVLNKVDLPAAEPDRVRQQIEDVIGLDASEAIPISAKTGLNIEEVLEAVVNKLPAPKGQDNAPLKALLVDSWYDSYLGVVVLVRIVDGELKRGTKIRMLASNAVYQVERVGVFTPKQEMVERLGPGEVGFITAAIKQVADTQVGDTIVDERNLNAAPLPGFKPVQQVVFCGLFPVDAAEFENLRDALAKLHLNDASFTYETESSAALGFGFRCGFLGLLHLEIIRERLDREFNIDLITTAPSVIYRIHLTDGSMKELHNPADMPDPVKVDFIEEPWIKATILVPDEHLGAVLKLCEDRRGRQVELTYAGSRAMVVYHLPLNEVVFDFYDTRIGKSIIDTVKEAPIIGSSIQSLKLDLNKKVDGLKPDIRDVVRVLLFTPDNFPFDVQEDVGVITMSFKAGAKAAKKGFWSRLFGG